MHDVGPGRVRPGPTSCMGTRATTQGAERAYRAHRWVCVRCTGLAETAVELCASLSRGAGALCPAPFRRVTRPGGPGITCAVIAWPGRERQGGVIGFRAGALRPGIRSRRPTRARDAPTAPSGRTAGSGRPPDAARIPRGPRSVRSPRWANSSGDAHVAAAKLVERTPVRGRRFGDRLPGGPELVVASRRVTQGGPRRSRWLPPGPTVRPRQRFRRPSGGRCGAHRG